MYVKGPEEVAKSLAEDGFRMTGAERGAEALAGPGGRRSAVH